MRTHSWARRLLLGPDDSWGATVATSPPCIAILSAVALIFQALDLFSGVHMMLNHGLGFELNPLARHIMATLGPVGLIDVKLGVVAAAILLLARTARAGRPRLARNCLLITFGLGMLGFTSNLVG